MPVLSVGDTVMITFNGNLCAQRTMNTFYYRCSAVPNGTDMEDAFISINATLGLAGGLRFAQLGATPSNYTLTQTWIQTIFPVRYRKVVFAQNQNGQYADTALTANVQAAITRAGSLANRESIGGVRIPIGSGIQSTDNGFIASALKVKLDALALAINQNIITAVGPILTLIPLVGAAHDGNQRDCAFAFTQDTTRVIRRRTVRVGE